MKRLIIFLTILALTVLPCSAEIFTELISPNEGSRVFIYHIPDDEPEILKNSQEEKPLQDIISDDVTADTSVREFLNDEKNPDDNNILLTDEQVEDLYPNILKGYAVYEREEGEEISLDENLENYLAIKIQQPYNYKGGKYKGSKKNVPFSYSKFSNMEYSISPLSAKHAKTVGGLTTGTMFNQIIDMAELEQSTGVFSRYDTKYFGVYTAYSRTLNSTNSNYNDNIYFSPELKLNQYFTLKEILSADITKNRKKAEFVVSINPFGNKDADRMRIEFSANATYDDTNTLLKNQLKFSTSFKW